MPENNDIKLMFQRAKAFEQQLRTEEAIEEYEKILNKETDSFRIWISYSRLLTTVGEKDAAKEIIQNGLDYLPNNVRLLMRYLSLTDGIIADETYKLLRKKYDKLDNKRLKANIDFSFGGYFDKRKEYSKASEYYKKANDGINEIRERFPGLRYNEPLHLENVNNVLNLVDEDFVKNKLSKKEGLSTKEPIFIVGMPRSGTTLMERILGTHTKVTAIGESSLLSSSYNFLSSLYEDKTSLESMLELSFNNVKREASRYFNSLQLLKNKFGNTNTIYTLDKMPDNYSLIYWILYMFPNSKIFYMKRDYRDIALSCYKANFTSIRWANNLDHMANRIISHHQLMNHYFNLLTSTFPGQINTVEYSGLVTNTKFVVRNLLNNLQLPWEEETITKYNVGGYIKTASVTQARQPIYSSSIGKWKDYEDLLDPLLTKISTIL